MVIPNTITSIENCAFYGCSGLTSVTIPNSVTSIGMDAFKGCSGLRYVNISDLEAWCKISFSGVFAPDVGRIGVSSNPLSYAHHLYLNGEEIKDLVIPNTVTSIKQFAFSGCCGLTSVIVPSPITTIGFAAFYGCDGMSTITIPNSMTSIGEYAFYGCKALEKVKCYAENVPQAELAFMDYNERFQLNPNSALYVPAQSLTKYKKFSYSRSWGCFKTIYAIEDGEPEKCSTPSISYANKQLTFSCETEGVEYHYTITDSDIKSDVASSINLSATYEISVYASKPGYYNSDVATATLVWTDAIFTETTETPTSAKAITESIPVLIFANGGTVTVKSEVDGQKVEVYAVNGQALGASTIQNGQATIATSMQRGEIVIVKVGNKSVKVKN